VGTVSSASYAMTSSYYSGNIINSQLPSQINVTGITGSFTGSHIGNTTGTASWSNNSLTASFVTASNVVGIVTSASYAPLVTAANYAITASWANTSSNAINSKTASYYGGSILNTQLPTQINVTGITASFTGSHIGNTTGTASWAKSASYAPNPFPDITDSNNVVTINNTLVTTNLTASGQILFDNRTTYTVGDVTIDTGITENKSGGAYDVNLETYQWTVYAYKNTSLGRVYSSNGHTMAINTDVFSGVYFEVNWNTVSGADGYRVVVDSDPMFGANGDYYFDTTSNGFQIGTSHIGFDDISGNYYQYGSQVVPNSINFGTAIDNLNGNLNISGSKLNVNAKTLIDSSTTGDFGAYSTPLTIKSTGGHATNVFVNAIDNSNPNAGIVLLGGGAYWTGNQTLWYVGTNNNTNLHIGCGTTMDDSGLTTAKDSVNGLTLDINGNLGVGKLSPSYKLDCNGSMGISGDLTFAAASNNKINFDRSNTTSFARLVFYTAGSEVMDFGLRGDSAVANSVVFSNYGTPLFSITPAGNVGIGNSNPSAILHAIGTTEQLRIAYNTSNYYSTTVNSNGSTIFNAVGTNPIFTFNQKISGSSIQATSFTGSHIGNTTGTASWANNALTASYITASNIIGNVNSSSYATTASYVSSSNINGIIVNALTASYVKPLNQTFILSGSMITTGSNTLIGNTTLTGSITISSSLGVNNPSVRIYGDVEHNGYISFDPVTTNIDSTISASYIYVSGSTNDLYFTQNGSGYGNTTRLRWLEGNLYTGLLNGGIISSVPGTTTFTVTSGSGIIVTLNAFTGSNPYPTIKQISWDTQTYPITYSGSAKITYVGINNTGAVSQQTTAWGSSDINQWDNSIFLGVVLHLSGSVSSGTYNSPQISYGNLQQTDDFLRAFGPLKISDHKLLPSGSGTTLSIIKNGGVSYKIGGNYAVNPNHPSTISENAITSSKIYRYYLSGSVPIIDTGVGNAGYTAIDNTQYVDTTTGQLSTVTNGKYSLQRVFWVPNSPTNAFIVYYGNAKYNSLNDAISAIQTEPFSEAPNTALNAILVAYIAVNGNAGASLNNTSQANIIQAGLFRSVGGTGGGSTAVSTALSALSDVALSGLSKGDLLVYGAAGASQWNNTKTLSGSYILSGSLTTGDGTIINNGIFTTKLSASVITASLLAGTASYAQNSTTASYITSSNISGVVISSSYSLSSSYAPTNTNITASWSNNSLSASYYGGNIANSQLPSQMSVTGITASFTGSFIGNLTGSNVSSSTGVFNTLTVTGLLNANQISGSQIYITSSQLTITDNILTLNAASPHLRYAGIEMYDSGSTQNLASILWDGSNNYFFVSSSDAGYSRKFVLAPDSEGDLTVNYIPVATGSNGLKNSVVYQSGSNIGIGTTTPFNRLDVVGNISASVVTASLFYGTASLANTASYLVPTNSYTITDLTASGNISSSGTITALTLVETSTVAAKSNILSLPYQLDKVMQLNPVSFTYKVNNENSIGLIAEEVGEIYPEFTTQNHDAISYGKITSVLIQSIKDLKIIIDNQQKEIDALKNK
jgi:hypothetical protein